MTASQFERPSWTGCLALSISMLILENLNLERIAYYEAKESRRHHVEPERFDEIEVDDNSGPPAVVRQGTQSRAV